jgi:hypothetical protein
VSCQNVLRGCEIIIPVVIVVVSSGVGWWIGSGEVGVLVQHWGAGAARQGAGGAGGEGARRERPVGRLAAALQPSQRQRRAQRVRRPLHRRVVQHLHAFATLLIALASGNVDNKLFVTKIPVHFNQF